MKSESTKRRSGTANRLSHRTDECHLTCQCGTRLRVPDRAIGKLLVECPKCGAHVRSAVVSDCPPDSVPNSDLAAMLRFAEDSDFQPDTTKRCPSCHRLLSSSVICTACGIDLRTGKPIATAADSAAGPSAGNSLARPKPVTWLDILRCPFQAEVVSDAIALSVATALWSIGLLFLLSFTIFWGGNSLLRFATFAVFHADPGSAGSLPRHADAADRNAAALSDTMIATASAVSGAIAIVSTFIALAGLIGLFYGTLRLASYLYGSYFAICRRAAYGAIGLADRDSGGLRDLGYALVMLLTAAGPFLAVAIFADGSSPTDGSPESDTSLILLGLSAVWAGLYFPMGLGVFAITRSLNPWMVVQWAWKCTPDYVWCCLLSGAFTGVVTMLCISTQNALIGLWPAGGTIAAWLLGVSLNQYNVVVTCTALGMLLRRHQAELEWTEA